jgi:hypothetical protein
MVLQAEKEFLLCIRVTTDSDNCIWLVGAKQVVHGRRNLANDGQSDAGWDRDDGCDHDNGLVGPLLHIRIGQDDDNDLYLVGEQQVFHGLRNHMNGDDDDDSTRWDRGENRASCGKCGL